MNGQKVIRLLVIISSAVFIMALSGCSANQELRRAEARAQAEAAAQKFKATMDAYVGKHKTYLIESLGPPDQILDDGKGGQIFVYTHQITTPGKSVTKKRWVWEDIYETYHYPETTTTYHKLFWIDAKGLVPLDHQDPIKTRHSRTNVS